MLKGSVFTTAAVDNIDHNPSATTAKDSFHGTGISLLQHPTSADDGVHNSTVIMGCNAGSKTVGCLPHFYVDVPPITSQSAVPATSVISLKRNDYKKHAEGEYRWLENTRKKMLSSGAMRMYHGLHIMQIIRNHVIESSHHQPYSPYFRRVRTQWQ